MPDLVTRRNTESLPALIDRAAAALSSARTSAEILEARDIAGLVYDAAKLAARFGTAKHAHDELIAAAHRAQADALEIEARAKRRLADEYDAAQANGEVAGNGQRRRAVPEGNSCSPPTSRELGLSRKDIHEARLVRDAEQADPGNVRRTLDENLDRGHEPTKAALRKMVAEAAMRGLRGGNSKKKARNPLYQPDPAFDAIAGINGCCRRITELLETHGPEFVLSGCVDRAMRERSIAAVTRGRNLLDQLLEKAHATS